MRIRRSVLLEMRDREREGTVWEGCVGCRIGGLETMVIAILTIKKPNCTVPKKGYIGIFMQQLDN